MLVIDSDPQYALTRQLGAEDRSLGVNLVAVLAGFSYHAILRAIRRGDLRAFEPVPGHYRIEVIEYERWLRHPARRDPQPAPKRNPRRERRRPTGDPTEAGSFARLQALESSP